MTHDLNGTGYDLTTSYGRNATGQITQRSSSNEVDAWTQGYNVARACQVNGLDQYTQSGSTTLGYDAPGNLNSAPTSNTGGNGPASGTVGYAYDADGQLLWANVNNQTRRFNYDAVGRLSLDEADNLRFGYAGAQAIHECWRKGYWDA